MLVLDGTLKPSGCPKCAHASVVPWFKGEASGSFCPKCEWWKRDLASVRHEFICKCGRYMGPIFVLETKRLGKYICFACAGARRSRGLNPNPRIMVRYEVWCEGGCGSLQAWLDLPEGKPVERRASGYFCTPCSTRPGPTLLFARKKIVVPSFAV